MKLDEEGKLILEAIDRSLEEWGVDRNQHAKFCEAARRCALQYHGKPRENPLDLNALRDRHLSADPKYAIKHVLTQTILETAHLDPSCWTIPKDKLNLHFAPKFRKWDDTSKTFEYRLRKDFYPYENSTFINPFKRFSYEYCKTAAEYVAKQWDNPAVVGGYIVEAMVACHLEHKEKCFNCKEANSLRWDGGPASSSAWANVVCIECAASYEIKSKHDQEKVLNHLIKYDHTRGGSFISYSKYRRPGKHFLVMAPRLPGSNGFHAVYIVQIDQVTPCLNDASFDPKKMDEMRIGSQIKVKTKTRQTWCVIPKCPLSPFHTIGQAYDEVFGAGEWEKKHPDVAAWTNRGNLKDDSLSASFRGLQINRANGNPWNAPPNHRNVRNETPRFATIGGPPSHLRTSYSRRRDKDADRFYAAEEEYHNANFSPRKDHKSHW